jgi:hypothetical protein
MWWSKTRKFVPAIAVIPCISIGYDYNGKERYKEGVMAGYAKAKEEIRSAQSLEAQASMDRDFDPNNQTCNF